MKTATIRLTAPLQSYGNQASFNQRTSDKYPSKSAVIGIIAAALGYRRDDARILQLNNLLFAVRIEQSGNMMTEFQTVEYQKSSTKTARKLTYREFIQDAVFMVAIGSDNDHEIEKIVSALKHPKFQLYLGRRSNPPAGPLMIETYDEENPLQVLEKLSWQAESWYQKRLRAPKFLTRIIADAELNPENNITMIKDKVGSFNQKNRYYQYRPVIIKKKIELDNLEYKSSTDLKTDLDYWSFV
ncbi:type I-E CRISPR-associated protein Cas5/CasD [Lactobacillus helveticus]|uniref:Type I-E CRISPR-associated protein Cas5/CasD n=1 Tax=Lactobacillus helveticus TaxID=1587 RepID=A0A8H9FAQ2_LACHE|nr:type I-E CRISPR-associated protein Cas5/CasD [Lactobacillus helveticus]KRO15435.1 CRISPR-associated protein [Lactobacillus helveticus]MBW8061946.1 type I-E CRISPR-associated protein Cas5/CasD [Lactobacillus helveticus]GFP00076.1 type I-E CRISPR-associated protein Cas5/CasD [Lactobacillus helveticus]GFP02056.1 type I-E CRISPR-associated protein Cas5/CasD [Lactobacillus helveticus]GFP02122.1 type I-E CRISPR-associated protein Cas5/CasD [Lactobacillus helveticus]